MRTTDTPPDRDPFILVRGGLDFITVDGSALPVGVHLRFGHELTTARCWLTPPEVRSLIAALEAVLADAAT